MLQAYLDRIGFIGTPRPDLGTLIRMHRGHVLSIPYENLDVQLGRKLTRSPEAAFDKIVSRGRGGWCYEMNGLLGLALEAAGFKVRRLAGAVMRDQRGDDMVGNHLVILVDLDGETFLCDAGFGDGLIEPMRLAPGAFAIGPYRCSLSRIEGGWWRYHNDPRGGAPGFDFHEEVSDEAFLERNCAWLQTDPASPFVQNAIAQRWTPGVFRALVGRFLSTVDSAGKSGRAIDSAEEYVATLRTVFGVDLPEAAALWPKILERHDAVFLAAPPH